MYKSGVLLSLAAILAGCATPNVPPDPNVLRVGVSPNARPVIFKQGGTISGIEADYARAIGQSLGKQVRFIEVPWDRQIEWLEQNRTDIIMSGMTITGARSLRINFCTPYLQSGLSALFRRDSYDASSLLASTVRNQNGRIGCVRGTTGEIYAYQRFQKGEKKTYSTPDEAVNALKSGKIDMFIYDAPIIWWLAAVNESALVGFRDVLNVEPLAWGVGKNNTPLLDSVNALLAKWEKDGTSQRILSNWIPLETR